MERESRRADESTAPEREHQQPELRSFRGIDQKRERGDATPRIVIDGTTVRVIAEPSLKLDIPRKQGFAWPKNAEAYAQTLASERGWKLEHASEPERLTCEMGQNWCRHGAR